MPCYFIKDNEKRKIISPKTKINGEIKQIKKIYVVENNQLKPVFIFDNRNYVSDWALSDGTTITYDNCPYLYMDKDNKNIIMTKADFNLKKNDKIKLDINIGGYYSVDEGDPFDSSFVFSIYINEEDIYLIHQRINSNTLYNYSSKEGDNQYIINSNFNLSGSTIVENDNESLIFKIFLESGGSNNDNTSVYITNLKLTINDKMVLIYE